MIALSDRYNELAGEAVTLIKREWELKLELEELRIRAVSSTWDKGENPERILAEKEAPIMELVRRRQRIESELQAFIADATVLAVRFSRQVGPATTRLEKARGLFIRGKYREAYRVLKEGDIHAENGQDIDNSFQRVGELGVKAGLAVINKQYGWYGLADRYYAEASRAGVSFGACLDYALFLEEHNRTAPALAWYSNSLPLAGDGYGRYLILNQMGRLWQANGEPDRAYKSFMEALGIIRTPAATDPPTHLCGVAETLNLLGLLLGNNGEQDRAEESFLEALEILGNPSGTCAAVLFRLAETMDNLGAVQRDKDEPDRVERSHSGAVEIWKRLALSHSPVHLPFLARSLNSLGTVRYEKNDLDPAGRNFSEALEIYRKLADPDPRDFQSFLSRTLDGLAELPGFGRGPVHPGQCIAGIPEIRRRLAWISSRTYLPFVAETLNSIGAVQRGKSQLNRAEQSYLEAYKIIERLGAADPGLFGINHATTAVSLAVIYSFDILDRSRAVFYARVAINGFLPFADTCIYAKKWLEVAEGILGCWE